MKRVLFNAEVSSPSLSLRKASAEIVCDREKRPRTAWFASSGEELWNSNEPESFRALAPEFRRTVVLRKNEKSALATPEHLSPVLLLYSQSYLEVHARSSELPFLDGSAYGWYESVRKLAGVPNDLLFYEAPIRDRFEWQGGYCEFAPAETLEIEYSLSHGNYADGVYAAIYEPADLAKIFPARSFLFEDDLAAARSRGLLAGVDASSGLLLRVDGDEAQPIVGGPFRMTAEPVYHKILDLIGDLSLPAPFLPRLRIRIHNGGHVAHRKLLERLLAYAFRNASQIV